jgi:hypothetical protein
VLPRADALMTYERQVNMYQKIREKVFPLLQPHTREWATEHFDSFLSDNTNFDFESRLIDADIAPYHILFDEQHSRPTICWAGVSKPDLWSVESPPTFSESLYS